MNEHNVTLPGNVRHRWGRVKEFINYTQPKDFWVDINAYLRNLVKGFIEDTMDEELIQYMQTQPYQRTDSRVDYRNGHYYRDLDTTLGPVEELPSHVHAKDYSGQPSLTGISADNKPLMTLFVTPSCAAYPPVKSQVH